MTTDTKLDAYYEEQLLLHGSDHPGMQLVSVLLTDCNYRMWKNAIITALESKDKLGIVDGTCPMPAEDSKFYRRWRKVNSMVTSWIKSAISKDLVSQFAYINYATDLWKEIEERYGSSNISMLFQIKREIVNMKQDNLGITEYYGKIKDLTDQLRDLRPIFYLLDITEKLKDKQTADYKEGAEAAFKAVIRLIEDRNMEDRALEFLLGLNDAFNIERSQVLLLDPLPAVNRIYSIMLKAEQNRQIVDHMGSDNMAMNVKSSQQWSRGMGRGRQGGTYRKDRADFSKAGLICTYCKKSGHLVENCFKLKGYPDWWENQKKKGAALAVQSSETPLDWNDNLVTTMEGFQKVMKEKDGAEEAGMNMVHMAHFGEFAGP